MSNIDISDQIMDEILPLAGQAGVKIATAESLTAGMVCAQLATISGISDVLQGGIIAYQNSIKEKILGVDPTRLARYGAVDSEVALHMARGVTHVLPADIGIATTGVAGPGSHEGKPAGTVYIGVYCKHETLSNLGDDTQKTFSKVYENKYSGNREEIRRLTTADSVKALHNVLQLIVSKQGF